LSEPEATRRAVFLDRDGTINEDHGYVYSRDELVWIPGAIDAIARLKKTGASVIVVTNLGGIGHGYYTVADVRALHRHMAQTLAQGGATVDGWYYCPFHPDAVIDRYRREAECRKPAPGMIMEAAAKHAIDLTRSYLVGDKVSDIEAGRRASVRTVLVRTGYGAEHESTAKSDIAADTIVEAVERIIEEWNTIP
jgi:D-glycero-D-manno-heptose 1,7-bisphosphate phosphatase